MAKILLVEDDNNLREIYEARLQAEGYDIATAMDGEEALVVAKKEHPDLIISDVMMPRISGLEMLDILRNTDELKHIRIIMLTALSQTEDKSRADSLGADRYLVKSQVTLEDIVKAAHELLSADGTDIAADAPAAAPDAAPAEAAPKAADDTVPAAGTASAGTAAATAPAPEPVAAEAAPAVIPVAAPPADDQPTDDHPAEPAAADAPLKAATPAGTPTPVTPTAPAQAAPDAPAIPAADAVSLPTPPVIPLATPPADQPADGDAAVHPISMPQPADELAGAQFADGQMPNGPAPQVIAPSSNAAPALDDAQNIAEEEAAMQSQIDSFINQPVTPAEDAGPNSPATDLDAAQAAATPTTAAPVVPDADTPAPQPEVTVPKTTPVTPASAAPAALDETNHIVEDAMKDLAGKNLPQQETPFVTPPAAVAQTAAEPTPAATAPIATPQVVPSPVPTADLSAQLQPQPAAFTAPVTTSTPVTPAPGTAPSAGPSAVAPTSAPLTVTPAPAEPDTAAVNDTTTISHKKVIKPLEQDGPAQPDLQSLLDKEGIQMSNNDSHPNDIYNLPGSSAAADGSVVQPHQPGNVITPNGAAPVAAASSVVPAPTPAAAVPTPAAAMPTPASPPAGPVVTPAPAPGVPAPNPAPAQQPGVDPNSIAL